MADWANIQQVCRGPYKGVLFDTCTLIELFKRQNEQRLVDFRKIPAAQRFTSIVVAWEFLRNREGQFVSSAEEKKRSRWLKTSDIEVLNLDGRGGAVTKTLWSIIGEGRHRGQVADTLIGTRALVAGYPIATSNERDFSSIPGIIILEEFASHPQHVPQSA